MFTDRDFQRMFDIAMELGSSVAGEDEVCEVSQGDNPKEEITEQIWTHESSVLGEEFIDITDDQGDKVNFTILTFDAMTYLRFVKEYESIVEVYGVGTGEGLPRITALLLETFIGEIGDGKYFLEKNSIAVVNELVGLVVDNIIL